MNDELETIAWKPTQPDGLPGDPIDVVMLKTDVETMRQRWREVAAMPTGVAKTDELVRLRFQMDFFAAFPGTRIVPQLEERRQPMQEEYGGFRIPPSALIVEDVVAPEPDPEPEPEPDVQPSLLDPPLALVETRARATDPWTSHAAAESISPHVRESQQAVLTVLREVGRPVDDVELVALYDREPKQSESGLRTRRSELVEQGLVRDSGHIRVLPSGRKAIRWEVAS